MFCTHCGAQLDANRGSCRVCGAAASARGAASASPAPPVPGGLNEYYTREFQKIRDSGETYKGKWNWAAFFWGGTWAMAKGMWLSAVLSFVLMFVTVGLAGMVYWIIFGARGNYMYYRKIMRDENPLF